MPGSPLRRLVEPAARPQLRTPAPSSVDPLGPARHRQDHARLPVATVVRTPLRRAVSAVTAGVKDVRQVIEDARRRLATGGDETVLFVDEVHRFSKSQQDALLPSVENRWVTLVAATTENPVVLRELPAAVPLAAAHAQAARDRRRPASSSVRAVDDERGLGGSVALDDDAEDHLLRLSGGDARKALTILEAAAGAVLSDGGDGRGLDQRRVLGSDLADVERAIDVAAVRYDRDGDQHYDVISAFIKSMRGSDVDASLHYLARMIAAGEDPRFIARRIVISAAEDVGMADPSALQTAVAAAQAVAAHRHARGAASSWPRPSCTWRPHRSRTPRTSASTRRSRTCAPAGSARSRRTCGTRTTRARSSWATATAYRVRARLAARRRAAAVPAGRAGGLALLRAERPRVRAAGVGAPGAHPRDPRDQA